MSLPAAPPSLADSRLSVREGSSGWPVYAVQTGLNTLYGGTMKLAEDGAAGAATTFMVKKFQRDMGGLSVDGVAGPATKAKMIQKICQSIDKQISDLPDGWVAEISRAEGGNNPAAVNPYTPVGDTPGTDCGIAQIRVFQPYPLNELKRAFDPEAALAYAAARFLSAVDKYMGYGWARNNKVRAQHLAFLSHNWPVGANDIAFEGRLSNPDGPASWVPNGVKMLDGTVVKTRQQWVDFYAGISSIGNPESNHQGAAPKNIKWGV